MLDENDGSPRLRLNIVWVCQQVPSAVQTKDPFNISNDEHYNPKVMDNALRPNIGSSLIQVCVMDHVCPSCKV